MDPNTARQVLRLAPDEPLNPTTVEAAFARESWERHPSRYPDAAGRDAATEWAATLAQARAVLLQSMTPTDAAPWTPPAAPTHPAPSGPFTAAAPTPATPGAIGPGSDSGDGGRPTGRRRVGLVVGIVAASAGVLALIVGAGFGAVRLAEAVVDEASPVDAPPDATPGGVVRYSADETLFTFPAALEEYSDGRYWSRCPVEFAAGCWESALITEDSCPSLEVDIEYTNDDEDWTTQDWETISIGEVAADAVTPVVFGNDAYDYGWVADVRCSDGSGTAASTNASAINTPLERLAGGRWSMEDTGFWFAAALEVYDDGRLGDWCPDGFERGCWQAALIPETSCDHLEIQYSLGNGSGAQQTQATTRTGIVAGDPVEVVFGHDDYEYGWISHVVCIT